MRTWVTIVVCLGVALPVLAEGRKIKVPKHYPDIQTAINSAEDGDTVIVDNGVWTGPGNKNLDFLGLVITVRSKKGPDNCTIDCEGEGQGFYFHSNETAESVVKGFTITRGDCSGICCSGSSPTITNCTIVDNVAYYGSGGGGGVSCSDGSPTITDCTITDNIAYDDGGGVFCNGSNAIINNCTIADNTSYYGGNGGGGIYCVGGTPTITNCTITGNDADYGHGGGVCCDGSDVTISNCTIADNTAYDDEGGGIRCTSGTISNCTITGNSAGVGGGICCAYNSTPTITNCTITGNTAVDGGGIYCSYNSKPTITNCILWGDTPEELSGSGEPTVTYCDVQGGWPGNGNIDADPLWATGPLGDFYLSQQQCGQPEDSPCLDAGKGKARKLGLKKYTTCTEGKKDKKKVDMGYHYPR